MVLSCFFNLILLSSKVHLTLAWVTSLLALEGWSHHSCRYDYPSVIGFVFLLVVLEIEPRMLSVLDKCSPTEICPSFPLKIRFLNSLI